MRSAQRPAERPVTAYLRFLMFIRFVPRCWFSPRLARTRCSGPGHAARREPLLADRRRLPAHGRPGRSSRLPNFPPPRLRSARARPTQPTKPPIAETSDRARPAISPRWSPHLRAPIAGSRELECLAAGIYFESKSEPLAGPARRRRSHRQPRRVGPLPVDLLRRAVSSAASSASFAAIRFRRRALAAASGRTPSRSPRSSTRLAGLAGAEGAVLPRPPRLAGLAPEARRHDRQPRLLPLGRSAPRRRFRADPLLF